MQKILSSYCALLTLAVSLVSTAKAVVPWTLLVNTNNIITVTDSPYNAVGDGVATNTTAIQNAINAAATGGTTNGLAGGTVRIPPGIYLCGPLTMKSSVNLKVDAGAILRLLPMDQYPGGIVSPANFINGSSLHDVMISGPGAIDGQGAEWWHAIETNSAAKRPRLINFSSGNRLLIQNITLSNSPMFHLALGGYNTTVQGVVIRAPSSSDPVTPGHNTDACDVNGTNILVRDCDISVGDDDFTCSGNTHDVLLTNNVYGNGHGVSIGSYTSGGVSDITVINCSFDGTDNGVRIKSARDRGGLVENINYLNLTMTNVDWPFLIYSYYEFGLGTLTPANSAYAAYVAGTDTNTAVTATTPVYRNITFSNITASANNSRPALMLWGLPQMCVSNVVFKNVTLSAARIGEIFNVRNVQFIDSRLNYPSGTNGFDLFNAEVTLTNSAPDGTLNMFGGVATNDWVNALTLCNALGSLKNTNALDAGTLSLAASTFTVSNHLSLAPAEVVNFTPGTAAARLDVKGNLELGGTNNIFAGAGFTNGAYTLMTYTGSLSGAVPALGTVPPGYNYSFDTNTAGQVKLVVTLPFVPPPAAPANLAATAGDQTVNLTWSASATATNYLVKRAVSAGGPYTTNSVGAVTSYADTDVTNGVTYYYVVSAVNEGGESDDSAEVSATPMVLSYIVVTTNLFTDTFGGSTTNLSSVPGGTPSDSHTSYDIASTKTTIGYVRIAPGDLKLTLSGPTTSGFLEAQALFAAAPVSLNAVGDYINLTYTFTNSTGTLLAGGTSSFIFNGLFNSGGSLPVAGGGLANSGLTANPATYPSGNCANWQGYASRIANGGSSQAYTRPVQSGIQVTNASQDLVGNALGGGAFSNPAGATFGGNETATVSLASGAIYTISYTIALTGTGALTVTNNLYDGTGTGGSLLFSQTNTASGGTYLTNAFDGLAIGVRNSGTSLNPQMDISRIAISARLTLPVASNPAPPAAPAGFQAVATNLQINLHWAAVVGATNYNLKRGTISGVYPAIFSGLTSTNYADAGVTNGVTYYYVVTAAGEGGESTNSLEASAAPLPSNQPTNITATVNGNQLELTWPLTHLGWMVEAQTNPVSVGLSNNWITISNTAGQTGYTNVFNPAAGSVYYRLRAP